MLNIFRFYYGIFLLFLFLKYEIGQAQTEVKTLISKEAEVELPLDRIKKNIYFTYAIDEETFSAEDLRRIIPPIIAKYFDTNVFYKIAENPNSIEYYVIYPCVLIDSNDLYNHKLIQNGYITANMNLKLNPKEYLIELEEFDWYNIHKNKISLSELYHKYRGNQMTLKEKVKSYGILKSAEHLIASSLENYVLVIDEIINQKLAIQNLPKENLPKENPTLEPHKIEFVPDNKNDNLDEFGKDVYDYYF